MVLGGIAQFEKNSLQEGKHGKSLLHREGDRGGYLLLLRYSVAVSPTVSRKRREK